MLQPRFGQNCLLRSFKTHRRASPDVTASPIFNTRQRLSSIPRPESLRLARVIKLAKTHHGYEAKNERHAARSCTSRIRLPPKFWQAPEVTLATICRMPLTVFDIKGVPATAVITSKPPWSRVASTRVAGTKRGSPRTRSKVDFVCLSQDPRHSSELWC